MKLRWYQFKRRSPHNSSVVWSDEPKLQYHDGTKWKDVPLVIGWPKGEKEKDD